MFHNVVFLFRPFLLPFLPNTYSTLAVGNWNLKCLSFSYWLCSRFEDETLGGFGRGRRIENGSVNICFNAGLICKSANDKAMGNVLLTSVVENLGANICRCLDLNFWSRERSDERRRAACQLCAYCISIAALLLLK
jgi:hypothetical protein